MKRFRISSIIAVVALAMISMVSVYCANMPPAFARTSDATLVQKAQKQGVKDCYNSNIIEPEVKTVNTTASANTLYFKDVVSKSSSPQVLLPYSLTNIVDNNITCNELFFGYNNRDTIGYKWFGAGGSISGLESNSSNISNGMITNPRAVESFMSSLGYTRNSSSNGYNASYGGCVLISTTYSPAGLFATDLREGSGEVCFDFKSDGTTRLSEGYRYGTSAGALEISESATQGEIMICPSGAYMNCVYRNVSGLTTAENAAAAISEAITSASFYKPNPNRTDDTFLITAVEVTGGDVQESDVQSGTYTRGTMSQMFNGLFGTTSTDTDYTYSELYDLYVNYYLRNGYEATISCVDPGDTNALQIVQTSVGTGVGQYRQVTLYYNGAMNETCFAKSSKSSTSEPMYVAAGTRNGQRHLATSVNFDGLISAINTLAEEAPGSFENILATAGIPGAESDPNITTEFINQDNQQNASSTDGDVGLLDGCFSNAGVLGWILCPVLKLAGAATDGIYDMIVENYLSVKSETMTSEALRGAWGTFQGYANILFAILLVIVILSQVTGIGLSNYGVKKVLPKLIITIVLVNLSYILCAIAVDLSNIVGTSLNDLLSGMDAGGFVASEINIGTMVLNSIEGIGLTALAIGASGTVITIAAEAWPNLILVLFLAVISILISILFFFILLVVRQAAIIIMVVIAPIAVVCYALPNTQKLFDRWLKAFSALLIH